MAAIIGVDGECFLDAGIALAEPPVKTASIRTVASAADLRMVPLGEDEAFLPIPKTWDAPRADALSRARPAADSIGSPPPDERVARTMAAILGMDEASFIASDDVRVGAAIVSDHAIAAPEAGPLMMALIEARQAFDGQVEEQARAAEPAPAPARRSLRPFGAGVALSAAAAIIVVTAQSYRTASVTASDQAQPTPPRLVAAATPRVPPRATSVESPRSAVAVQTSDDGTAPAPRIALTATAKPLVSAVAAASVVAATAVSAGKAPEPGHLSATRRNEPVLARNTATLAVHATPVQIAPGHRARGEVVSLALSTAPAAPPPMTAFAAPAEKPAALAPDKRTSKLDRRLEALDAIRLLRSR